MQYVLVVVDGHGKEHRTVYPSRDIVHSMFTLFSIHGVTCWIAQA